jgi:hypothetical protein
MSLSWFSPSFIPHKNQILLIFKRTSLIFYILVLSACAGNTSLAYGDKEYRNQDYGDLDISGMARLDDGRYLVAHDTKHGNSEPRLGILTINEDSSPKYAPIFIKDEDWNHEDGPSNDLESICRLSGEMGHQFLIAESGKRKEKFGRIFHIKLFQNDLKKWEVHVIDSIPLPKGIKNIEGIGCFISASGATEEKKLLILLGERGDSEAGKIILWELDLENHQFKGQTPIKSIPFSAPDWPENVKNRDISDIYIDSENTLWISSTEDPGDAGPFKSIIYIVGKIDTNSNMPLRVHNRNITVEKVWELDGIKVEALGAPPLWGNGLSIGTDDENYGGIWRPLFKK